MRYAEKQSILWTLGSVVLTLILVMLGIKNSKTED
jgi:hypothetical protein